MLDQLRIDHDSMGDVPVPAEALWGAQTQRSLKNFAISKDLMPLEIIYALAMIKQASAIANKRLGVINSRHLLYGAVLSEYLEKLSLVKKLLISYLVVDQGFAESNKFFQKNKNEPYLHYHLLGSGGTLWIFWQLSTLAGIILGSFVPEELGLKFAVPLTFIAIVVQDLKKLDHVIVMITCGLSSLLFFDAPFKSYIIISPIISLFVAALVLRLKK